MKMTGVTHRMAGLDALRGIAALLVVLYHYTVRYQEAIAPHNAKMWLSFNIPAIGVQIFFAISGFVIFMTLERCSSGRDFFVSRFARLYPPFIFCMLLSAAIALGVGFNPRDIVVSDVVVNLFMAVGLLNAKYVDGSYWTLTCEICFYMLIAVFFYQIQRRSVRETDNFDYPLRNPLLMAAGLWMVVAVIGRVYTTEMYSPLSLGLNFMYGHLFLAGIAVYGFSKGKTLVPGLMLAIAVISGGFSTNGDFSLLSALKVMLIAMLIGLGAYISLGRAMTVVAGFLGGISYSLYLIHQAAGYFLINVLENSGVNANIAVYATLAVMMLLAYLIRRYVEIPTQRLISQMYAPWKSTKVSPVIADPMR